jgi:hypothetical protein
MLTASYVVTQSTSAGTVTVTDTSNYAANGGQASFTNRQLWLYYIDGTTVIFQNQPNFSFANYPSNSISIPISRDFALNIVMTVDDAVAATITTAAITGITQTAAVSGGNVTSDGGTAVTAYGVCWATTANPTLANSFTTDGTGTGVFVSNITGLTSATTYYVRAYATNAIGTAYGNQQTFNTLADIPIVLNTQPVFNFTANKGSFKNLMYVVTVINNATFHVINEVAVTGIGTFVNGDLANQGLELYKNIVPSFNGSEVFVQASSEWNASPPAVAGFLGLNIGLNPNETLYLLFSLNINSTATTGHTFEVQATGSGLLIFITGNPTQTNNLTNNGAIVTVGT